MGNVKLRRTTRRAAAIAVALAVISLVPQFIAEAKPSYVWTMAAPRGSGCFMPNCTPGQFLMAVQPVEGINGDLFIIGSNKVWTSTDGTTWSDGAKTDWGERHGQRYAYFQNKLWMLGGMRAWEDFKNDVWSSDDGRNWVRSVSSARWRPRRGHGTVVFKEKLWVIGGSLSSGKRDATPTKALNDVWSSVDGVNWRLETENAGWSPREAGAVLVFKDRLWVIGGTGESDVWSSKNGRDWTLDTANAPWGGRHGVGSAVLDGRMWIYGGGGKNDVWSSFDGKTWHRVFAEAPWSKRSAAYSVVYKNRLLLFSGKTGRDDSWQGEIWAMSKRSG